MQYPDPFRMLLPGERWAPSQSQMDVVAYDKVLPPLVYKIRNAVTAWRDKGYEGASATSRALLQFWFEQEHTAGFRFYFSQREAIETFIYLYEIAKARDKYDMMRFDASGRVSTGNFEENWPRYVVKMATGAGKTKVMALTLVWSYFHKKYETDSPLSQNFLVVAPNIIVLNGCEKILTALRCSWKSHLYPKMVFMTATGLTISSLHFTYRMSYALLLNPAIYS